jgi:UDP-N-acetylglucosamine 2-epimerase (non-hydrolysing)
MRGTGESGGENRQVKWILVCAARPNFMKIAPLMRAIEAHNSSTDPHPIRQILVHTGQHYDENMSDAFFRDLAITEPEIHLGVGSGTHAEQTGQVMASFEEILLRERPDLVVVVGDVNSTMACALAAAKLRIPVAHVEAGLRSFDRTMPEEINRVVTDAVSDYLFTPSPDGDANLRREGVPKEKIFLVGDIMIDSLLFHMEQAERSDILKRMKLQGSAAAGDGILPYALLTMHRPANVDDREVFGRILHGLSQVAVRIPVLFPAHPRTVKQIRSFGMQDAFVFHASADIDSSGYWERARAEGRVHAFEPFGYLDFLNLMAHAKVVLTDSGGIQEETTVLDIPCVTIRSTTERPITVTEGTNVLVGDDPERILAETARILDGHVRKGRCPRLWDGRTAKRIVEILVNTPRGQAEG